jgi:serine/threonine protein kinase
LTDGASSYEGRSETAPHLLNFYGAFVDKDAAYVNLVVEYMDGGSLQDKVDKGPCTDENVLADISSQILKVCSTSELHVLC